MARRRGGGGGPLLPLVGLGRGVGVEHRVRGVFDRGGLLQRQIVTVAIPTRCKVGATSADTLAPFNALALATIVGLRPLLGKGRSSPAGYARPTAFRSKRNPCRKRKGARGRTIAMVPMTARGARGAANWVPTAPVVV